jgi:uncharacterized integral membrane protein
MPRNFARASRNDKMLAFAFGVVFLLIVIGLAIFNPDPSDFSYTVFRIVLALAAAGVGAVLPGFLTVYVGNWVRAGGAIALFVIVYFFAPAPPTSNEGHTRPPPTAAAKPAADAWLKIVDEGRYEDAYRSMADSVRSQYTLNEVLEIQESERRALGSVLSRKVDAASSGVNPPGLARGFYRYYGYRTRFSKEPRIIYEQVNLIWEKNSWRVMGFFTWVKTNNGAFVSYDPPDQN